MNIVALMCAISAYITHVSCEGFIGKSPAASDESSSSIDCLLIIREVLILNRTDDDEEDHIWCCQDDIGVMYEIIGLDSSFYDDNDAVSGKSRLYSNQSIKLQDPTTGAPKIMIGPNAKVKSVQDQSRGSLSSVTGIHSVLVIRVISADGAPSRSASLLSDDVFGTSSDTVNLVSQYNACSAGKLQFVPAAGTNIVNGVIEVTISQSLNGVNRYTAEAYVTSTINSLGFPSNWFLFYVMQDGVDFGTAAAYAYINAYLSVYRNRYIYMVMIQMHEVGHNLGMYHSGEGSSSYGDHTCMMGNPRYADEQPKMCFNGQKSWFSTWYNDRHASAEPAKASWKGKLAGIDDYVGGNTISGQHYVVLRIIDTTGISNYLYIMYNRRKGVTSGVVKHPDKVTVIKGYNNDRNAAPSYLQTALSANQEYRISNFSGQSSTLVIKVCDMESGTPDYAYVLIYLENSPLVCPGIITPLKNPSTNPSFVPSLVPSSKPSFSINQSTTPSLVPSVDQKNIPSLVHSKNPTSSQRPSKSSLPNNNPSKIPSSQPSRNPSKKPSLSPTKSPTKLPTLSPTKSPTKRSTLSPTKSSTKRPTLSPTKSSTKLPTLSPTKSPTKRPTLSRTKSPTKRPTLSRTKSPTKRPTLSPTKSPANRPTLSPTKSPTKRPTLSPTKSPTKRPTLSPTKSPTKRPTLSPTKSPTKRPTLSPTKSPTNNPTLSPTKSPTKRPTLSPTKSSTKRHTLSSTKSPTKNRTNIPLSGVSVNCNRHTSNKRCQTDSSGCCEWDRNNRTCDKRSNCQPLNCVIYTNRQTCLKDGSGCCRWINKKNTCKQNKNCQMSSLTTPTKNPTKRTTINCSTITSKKICNRDPSGCCKWKSNTCISEKKCKINVKCSKYTAGEKQCNKASKCCRWKNRVCSTRPFCSQPRKENRLQSFCKRHTKQNKCERDTSSCCRWHLKDTRCTKKASCKRQK